MSFTTRGAFGAAAALVLLAVACAKDSAAPPPAPVVASTEITTAPTTLSAIDQTVQLAAVARDSGGDPIASASIGWTSLAPAIIGVSSGGLATAKANGTAEIVASSGGKADTVVIGLTQLIDSVVITPSTWTATRVGQRLDFTAAALDANGHPVAGAFYKYRSSDEAVVEVDSLGIATARSAGSATLTTHAAINDSAVAAIDVQITTPGGAGIVYTLFPARMDSSPVVLQNGSLFFDKDAYGTPLDPVSPWPIAGVIDRFAWSRDNIAVITDMVDGKGTLWLKDRISEWAVAAIGDAVDVKIEVSRFGWLTADGRLRMKTDPHGPVTEIDGNGVQEFQLAHDRIAALKQDGTLRIKEGTIDATWVAIASDVERFQIKGTHIAVLNAAGQFRAKVGVNDPWTVLADTGVVDFRVSSQLVGILKSNGELMVKEGINGTWALVATSGVEQFELEGDHIIWLLAGGDVRVKDGPFGTPADIGTAMREVRLQGDFIGQVSTAGQLSVKRGINGPPKVVGTYPNLEQYRLIVDVPSPPHRTSGASYSDSVVTCAEQAAGDFCISPYRDDPRAIPYPPLYGRWCGDGRPTDGHANAVRDAGPLDAFDKICHHHDNAGSWYPSDDSDVFNACIVRYGLQFARLTNNGSLIPRGAAEYEATFGTTMPRLHAVTEAYWDFTSGCTETDMDQFITTTAATH